MLPGLLSHPQGLQLVMGQRQQRTPTSVLPQECLPCCPLGGHSHGVQQPLLLRERMELAPSRIQLWMLPAWLLLDLMAWQGLLRGTQQTWHEQGTQGTAVLTQAPRVTPALRPAALSRVPLTPQSCRQPQQEPCPAPSCPLLQLLGMEQEQPRHREKCPRLVPWLPAMWGWSPTSQGLKDQDPCPVKPPVLPALLSHLLLLLHLELRLGPAMGQRQQQTPTSVLPREPPYPHSLWGHSRGGWQLVLPREQLSLGLKDQAMTSV